MEISFMSPKEFFDRSDAKERVAKLVAFLAGNHPRCGVNSPLLQLPRDVMKWVIESCTAFSAIRRYRRPAVGYLKCYEMTMTTFWGDSRAYYDEAGTLVSWTYYDFCEFYVDDSWSKECVKLRIFKLHHLKTTPMIRIVGRTAMEYVLYYVSDEAIAAEVCEAYRYGQWEACMRCLSGEPPDAAVWILPVIEWIKWRICKYSTDRDECRVKQFVLDLRKESGFPAKISPPGPG
jgi:hypothetical protein